MFRDKPPGNVFTINALINGGGVGDLLCSLIPINHIRLNYPWINPIVWVPDFLLEFSKHVLPKGTIVKPHSKGKKEYNNKLNGITTQWSTQHTPMRTHPVDYAYHQLTDHHPYDPSQRNYLKIRPPEIDVTDFNLPKYYAVVTPTATEEVKRFPPKTVDQISDHLNSLGLTPVYLGKEEIKTHAATHIYAKASEFDASKGLNLLNKTDLLQAAAVISGAKLFVGMDGGLVHLAGFTDTKIVAGYTFAAPYHLMPIRNDICGHRVYPIVPDESLGCRFCQTNWGLMYSKDFRECHYSDYLCAKMMTSDKFIKKIDEALK